MSVRTATQNPLIYQATQSATATFERGRVLIKGAYSINGRSYDITYQTTDQTIQKLRNNPALTVRNLQEQMRAYLEASNALRAPEKTSFELRSNHEVYARTQQGRYSISDRVDSTTQQSIRVMAQSFHQYVSTVPIAELPLPQPAQQVVPPTPASPTRNAVPAVPIGLMDYPLFSTGMVSKLNLLTYGSQPILPNISGATGFAALTSGLIGIGQNGIQAYSQFKAGDTANGLESMVKTAAAGSELVNGLGTTFGIGPSTLGPIAYSASAGFHLLIHLKDLLSRVITGKELPPNFWSHFLTSLAMFIAPILILTATFSNPFLAPILFAAIALIGFMKTNQHVLKDMFAKQQWGEIILYFASIIIPLVIFALGVPYAPWIAGGVSLGINAAKVAVKKLCQKAPQLDQEELQQQIA